MTGTSRILRIYVGFVGILLVFPLLIVLAVSFDPGSYIAFPPSGFSLKSYVEMWSNDTITLAIKNSLIVGLISSLLGTLLAVPAALAIARGGAFSERVLYPLLLSPFAIPWLVYGLALLFFWSVTGQPLSLWTIILGHTVIAIPYILRITLAVLRDMPPNYVRAARVAGATPWNAFRHVVLPYIQPGIIAGASFAFIVSFTNIPVSLFLTTADNITLPVAIFNYMINNFEPMVATVSVVQVVMIAIVLLSTRMLGATRG
ncbi:ABC transporter permease [Bradyrhizobium sp. dw_78]|uniref:ABC transporter permease n=1 Tax=Bradyrhizobium sp. dw_78 TaxID=2719793 RepID=UPI001BD62747|nr:ABC transporter permease [Bradyrhizobium sp. dw_78]